MDVSPELEAQMIRQGAKVKHFNHADPVELSAEGGKVWEQVADPTSPLGKPINHKRRFAGGKGRTARHEVGRMNKMEAAYARKLDERKQAGEVSAYWFESVKLRLADKTWYTPDFLVMLADGLLELHEVKGFWEDDARVKWKVAAEQFPLFVFVAATRSKKEWSEERYRG